MPEPDPPVVTICMVEPESVVVDVSGREGASDNGDCTPPVNVNVTKPEDADKYAPEAACVT